MSLSKVKVFTPPLQLIGLVFIFIYALFGIQFFSERSEVLLSVYFQESWANVRSAHAVIHQTRMEHVLDSPCIIAVISSRFAQMNP